MTEKNSKAEFNLSYLIKERVGKDISSHSLKGKENHTVSCAYFPFVIKELRKVYEYYDLLKKPYKELSEAERVSFERRKRYVSETLYPKFLSTGLSPEQFADVYLNSQLTRIKNLWGKLTFDDTLHYGDPPVYVDWVRINRYQEQLVLSSKRLNAEQRYRILHNMAHGDYELLQKYVDIWRSYPVRLEDEIYLVFKDISHMNFAKQQFEMAISLGDKYD